MVNKENKPLSALQTVVLFFLLNIILTKNFIKSNSSNK